MRSTAAVLAVSMLVLGCARLGPSVAAAPGPLTEEEITAFAELLQLEDRRELDLSALAAFAESASPRVRARTAIALGRLREADAAPSLFGLLEDADTSVAARAAFALGQVGDTSAVRPLARLLTDPSPRARPTVSSEAAYALGKLGTDAARAALRRLIGEAPVRSGAPTEVVGSALLAIWRFPRDAAPDPIARWLDSPDPELRWRAAYALVRRPDPAAVRSLLVVLGDHDERARALAVRGLTAPLVDSAGVGSAAVLPGVLARLEDPSYIVRINAIGALGTYPGEPAVRALEARLTSEEPHEVLAAVQSLGRIGESASRASRALEALEALSMNSAAHPAHRSAALDALARVSPERGMESAAALARADEWRVRAAAARVLAGSARPQADLLLRDADGRVAAAALDALVGVAVDSSDGIRGTLIEALGSPDVGVRAAALRGIRSLGDPATLPLLLDAYGRALQDPVDDAALAALQALAALRRPGTDPSRALFARYPNRPDHLLVRAAVEAFGSAAERAWGPPHPISTGRSIDEYRQIVLRWIAPVLQGEPGPVVEIGTAAGPIRFELHSADAPLTAASIDRLARAAYFDSQEWPRVVPNFVVQGGDPRGDTSGGPGYSIRDEINRRRYGTGTVGMALSGPDTGGSQFFITHSPQPHLDGIYTIFGTVVAGQEVTERILPGDTISRLRVHWTRP